MDTADHTDFFHLFAPCLLATHVHFSFFWLVCARLAEKSGVPGKASPGIPRPPTCPQGSIVCQTLVTSQRSSQSQARMACTGGGRPPASLESVNETVAESKKPQRPGLLVISPPIIHAAACLPSLLPLRPFCVFSSSVVSGISLILED
jgi:hypothetical protein